MTGFRATDETGRVVDDLTPADLDVLLRSAERVEIVNPAWGAEHRAVASHSPDEVAWTVQITGHHRSRRAVLPGRPAAYDVLRSWAAGDGWWQDAFGWEPIED